jgi:hypothetical protein
MRNNATVPLSSSLTHTRDKPTSAANSSVVHSIPASTSGGNFCPARLNDSAIGAAMANNAMALMAARERHSPRQSLRNTANIAASEAWGTVATTTSGSDGAAVSRLMVFNTLQSPDF